MSVKVSVIIPNFNHSSFLEQRLDSVLNQTVQDIEVILLDDASTDGSTNILEAYKNHPLVSHLIVNKTNSGSPFKQWKRGLEFAKGEYIWIAESDDYCSSNFLEVLLREVEGNSLVYSQSIDVDENGTKIGERLNYTKEFNPNLWESNFEIKGQDFIKEYLLYKNVIPNASAVVFSKQLYKKEYFTKELLEMKFCGDWLFWILLSEKARISFVNQELNFFRTHRSASRIHNNKIKRKGRIAEELMIREFLKKKYNLVSKKKNQKLISEWVLMHKLSDLVHKEFYCISSNFIQRVLLLGDFIKTKTKIYLK